MDDTVRESVQAAYARLVAIERSDVMHEPHDRPPSDMCGAKVDPEVAPTDAG